MKKSYLLVLVLLPGIILTAGCTGPASPAGTGPDTPVPGITPIAVPETPATPSVPITTSITARSVPARTDITTVPTTRIASDNPYLEYLNIRKRTFDYPLPNCLMQNAFPAIANNTYGIKQVVPKLTNISEDDYLTFLRRYTEENAENTQLKTPKNCQGSVADPTWNFVEVRIILDPTNVQPAEYTITQNVFSDGKIVYQFPVTKRLVIDEKVTLISYIPIRSDEVDLVDSVGVTYTRH
jgi:hypothetical protein